VHHDFKNLEPMNILGQTTLLTLWGFIGLETATTSAGSVVNASKNIPRAIVCGTIAVASIYLLSSTAIMGLIPPTELANSQAPYSDAIKLLFGGNWYIAMSLLAAVICVGSLNAWILTSGQILLGLSNDGFVPSKLKECNKNGSPAFAIILGSSGIAPLLFLVMNDNLSNQIKDIIDISVTAFLFIYLICCVSFFKLIFQNLISKKYAAAGLVSAVFCLWVLYETNLYTIVSAALFIFSALPLYLLWYRKNQRIVK
jgi:APA family basic amino acid/polyamine antiporter